MRYLKAVEVRVGVENNLDSPDKYLNEIVYGRYFLNKNKIHFF